MLATDINLKKHVEVEFDLIYKNFFPENNDFRHYDFLDLNKDPYPGSQAVTCNGA